MFGDHATFIVPSYLITFFILIGLVLWLRLQFRGVKNELAELEKSGIKRRSNNAQQSD